MAVERKTRKEVGTNTQAGDSMYGLKSSTESRYVNNLPRSLQKAVGSVR